MTSRPATENARLARVAPDSSVSHSCPPTTIMAHFLDRRTSSSSSQNNQQRSPSPPSQTFHPALVPTPIAGLVGVAAGGSHYSGAKIHHRRSDVQRASFGGNVVQHIELDEQRTRILDDLKEVRPVPCMLYALVLTYSSCTPVGQQRRYSRDSSDMTLSTR